MEDILHNSKILAWNLMFNLPPASSDAIKTVIKQPKKGLQVFITDYWYCFSFK